MSLLPLLLLRWLLFRRAVSEGADPRRAALSGRAPDDRLGCEHARSASSASLSSASCLSAAVCASSSSIPSFNRFPLERKRRCLPAERPAVRPPSPPIDWRLRLLPSAAFPEAARPCAMPAAGLDWGAPRI